MSPALFNPETPTRIFFGERDEEEEEEKPNREDRFKQLEAKQREREGLVEVNRIDMPGPSRNRPATTTTHHQANSRPAQVPDSPHEDNNVTDQRQPSLQSKGISSLFRYPTVDLTPTSPVASSQSKRKITGMFH